MKRALTGETHENKETQWPDDVLCYTLLYLFPGLAIKTAHDFARLQALQRVSRQFNRIITTQVVPVLQNCARDVFASLSEPWRVRFTGLTSLCLFDLDPPVDFGLYRHLRRLDAWCTREASLRSLLPLTQLHELHICVAALTTLRLDGMTGLRKLVVMGTKHCSRLAHLSALTALEALELNRAQLVHPDELTALHRLRDLSFNPLNRLRDRDLVPLTQLHRLNLSYNTYISDATLYALTQLRELDLAYDDRITEAALYGLTQLHTLRLDGNVSVGCGPLLCMPHLTSLRYMHCITIVPREFALLTQLVSLDLRGSMDILQSTQWLTSLTRLERLCITTPQERITSTWVTAMPRLCHLVAEMAVVTKRAHALLEQRDGHLVVVHGVDDTADDSQ